MGEVSMKKAWKQIGRAAGFWGIYFAGQLTAGMLLSVICSIIVASKMNTGASFDYQAYSNAVMELAGNHMGLALIGAGILTLGVYLIIFAARKVNPLAQVDAKKISLKDFLFVVIGGFGTMLFMNQILNIIPFSEAMMDSLNDAVGTYNQYPLWQGILANAILIPILEEVVFRGLLYGRLRRGMPEIVAALITSAVFGIGHTGPIWMAWAFCVGMILNFARSRTGSIAASIVIHMMINTFAVIANYELIVLPQNTTVVIISTIVGAVLLAVYFFGLYKVTKKEKEEGKIKEPLLEEEEVSCKEETTVVVM